MHIPIPIFLSIACPAVIVGSKHGQGSHAQYPNPGPPPQAISSKVMQAMGATAGLPLVAVDHSLCTEYHDEHAADSPSMVCYKANHMATASVAPDQSIAVSRQSAADAEQSTGTEELQASSIVSEASGEERHQVETFVA